MDKLVFGKKENNLEIIKKHKKEAVELIEKCYDSRYFDTQIYQPYWNAKTRLKHFVKTQEEFNEAVIVYYGALEAIREDCRAANTEETYLSDGSDTSVADRGPANTPRCSR